MVAERLAAAGRQDGQHVFTAQNAGDGLQLAGQERLEAEEPSGGLGDAHALLFGDGHLIEGGEGFSGRGFLPGTRRGGGGSRSRGRGKGGTQFGQFVRVTARKYSLQVGDAGLLTAGAEVVAQTAQVGHGQWALRVGGAEEAHGVGAGGHPVVERLVEGEHTQQVGAALRAQLVHAAVGDQRGLRIAPRQFDLAQQSPGHRAVVSFLDKGTGDLVGGLHVAPGQVDAGQERAGGEGGLVPQPLLHHRQGLVGPALGQEGLHAQVEERDERGVRRDEGVQAGVKWFDVLPAQEEIEQTAAVAA